MSDEAVISSLQAVLEKDPGNVALRLHLAALLLRSERGDEAIAEIGAALRYEPANETARTLMAQALEPDPPPTERSDEPAATTFDWKLAEEGLGPSIAAPYVDGADTLDEAPVDIERHSGVRLDDVAGMREVKERLELAFLGPMRNQDLAAAFGKSLRGGLLLYGPPGVGKTYLARALAGEMGAAFTSVSLADILDSWLGAAEKNIKNVFEFARRNSPCVLFFDEVDALGQRRSKIGAGWTGMRGAVQQLLTEMDSVGSQNDGVFILGATNAPWDIDPALRRPGRFDRTVLVVPPDVEARTEILHAQLDRRPISGIDLAVIVRATEDFSGADLAHLCESAAELALADSMRAGEIRPLAMADFETALKQVGPSTKLWFESVRNVIAYGNSSGQYDDLAVYMNERGLI
jgi:SpoVK/Ycf46/Vps4 family AAA+-type ATPase